MPNGGLVCVMAIYGRRRLTLETVRRLSRQTYPVDRIVLVGSTDADEQVAREAGADFVRHDNFPLSDKWQAGIDFAHTLDPEAILILGSDDWLSDGWCETAMKEIRAGADLVGKRHLYVLNIGEEVQLLEWSGYTEERRQGEPVGAGRVFSRAILERLEWRLFSPGLPRGLDHDSYSKLVDLDARVHLIEDPSVYVIDIKSSSWSNLTAFENFASPRGRVELLDRPEARALELFPDLREAIPRLLPKQLNVVFVFADQPSELNCSAWRMFIPASAMARAGHVAHTFFYRQWLQREPFHFQCGRDADLIVYERVLTDDVAQDIRYWKSHGKKIAIDFDDAYHVMPPTVTAWAQWHQGTPQWPVALIEPFRRNLGLADVVTMPSELLAEAWASHGPTRVLRNHPDLSNPNWRIRNATRDPLRVGWGGGRSHLHSFRDSGILPALRNRRTLLVGGGNELAGIVPGCEQADTVPFAEWPYHLGRIGIGLAPLSGEYDDHRSWIKALEYSLKGIPWVATDAPPYRECRGGIRVENRPDAWREAIESLEKDTDLYEQLSKEGKAWAWQQGIDQRLEDRLELYEEVLTHG